MRNRRINVSVCLELCKRSVKLNFLPPLLVNFLDGSFHDLTLFCNQRVFMWGAVGQASNTHFSYLMLTTVHHSGHLYSHSTEEILRFQSLEKLA